MKLTLLTSEECKIWPPTWHQGWMISDDDDYSPQIHLHQRWKVQSHSQGEVRRLHASNITNTGTSWCWLLYTFFYRKTFLLQKADEGWFECQISSTPVISHLVYLNIAGWLIMTMHRHTENINSSKLCTLPIRSLRKTIMESFWPSKLTILPW